MNTTEEMLYSVVLTLSPTHEATLRATMGHQAHAAFLRTVEEADSALSEALHTPNLPVRPFSVSPLQGTPPSRNGQVHLSPEQTYWLRFTILYPPIFERFMQRFLRGEGRPTIRLGEATLLIREILTTPESHPWAGYTTWESLAQHAQDERDVTLEFMTPTAFSFGQKEWGKKIIVLPQPEVVFDNLARAWDNLAPPQVQMDRSALKTYLEEHVVIKRIEDLTTQMLDFGKARQVGFVGSVTYGLMGENTIARAQLNMLADFAFYAGVGYKTTMGMGQCRKQEAGSKGREARTRGRRREDEI